MTTLIAVYNSDGCVGRCDARCYNPLVRSKRCTCICGGKNHGAGKQQSMDNVRQMVGLEPEDLERFAKHRELKCEGLVAIDRLAEPNARHARHAAYMELMQTDLFRERRA